jgi:hypothetical protein
MRREARFVQLPHQYDVEREKDVAQFRGPRPQRFAGNEFLSLGLGVPQ